MSDNQLTISNQNVVALTLNTGISEMIKPLTKEIFLFDTFIAGTTYVKDKTVLENIKIGDKLVLRREPDNKYDDMAILVLSTEGAKLGYIPEKDNPVFARLMDAGKLMTAKVDDIAAKGNYYNIRIKLFLTDF
jgi:hypothetical protein